MAAVLTATVMLAQWETATPVMSVPGYATFYSPNAMERVAVVRGFITTTGDYAAWLDSEAVVGAVALNRAGDLGRRVWLSGPAGTEGPFLVIDCARLDHFEQRESRHRVVEVDWLTAQRWGMRGPIAVTVRFEYPEIRGVE